MTGDHNREAELLDNHMKDLDKLAKMKEENGALQKDQEHLRYGDESECGSAPREWKESWPTSLRSSLSHILGNQDRQSIRETERYVERGRDKDSRSTGFQRCRFSFHRPKQKLGFPAGNNEVWPF